MRKGLLYTIIILCVISLIIPIVYMFIKSRFLERYENDKTCFLTQYFTQDGIYTNNPEDENYWLKQQSSAEKEIYDTLLKEADDAETNGNLSDASVIRSKIEELQETRLNLRMKALDTLEQSMQIQERDLGTTPKPDSCTVKSSPIKIFEISDDNCSITSVIGEKQTIYSFPDILKPTKGDKIFTPDNIESCYINIPKDVSLDIALVMVLNVLDAIGEKTNAPILEEINRIIEETRVITRKTDLLRNVTIPKSKSELQSTIDSYYTSRENLSEMRRRNARLKNSNKLIDEENNKYSKDVDDIVEIFEHCNGQGRKFILKQGFTSFTGTNAKLIEVSSIYFNDKKGLYVVMYDKDYNPYTIRKSVDCLTNVNIGGKNGVNLNDNVIAIEVIKSNKRPSSSMIASGANQKKVLDVSGYSTANLANIHGWDAHGGNNQKWTYNTQTKNIVSTNSGKCLDALYAGTNNFTKVIQYDCHGGNNMKWDFLDNGQIKNVNAQKCLQADPNNTENNGFDIYLYDCDPNSQYQQWNVIDDLSYMKPKPIPQISVLNPPQPQPQPQSQPQPQPQPSTGCNKSACSRVINDYLARNWWYKSSDFGECRGCPVVKYPKKL